MRHLAIGFNPKEAIRDWGNTILEQAQKQQLVNPYEVYEILLNYWAETMQDDCYLISRDGWKLTTSLPVKKKPTYREILCDLVPVDILVKEYFSEQENDIVAKETEIEQLQSDIAEAEEENPQELEDSPANIKKRLAIASQPAPMTDAEIGRAHV